MTYFSRLLEVFDRVVADFDESAPMQLLRSPEFSREHYASALREFFFYTRESPQLQAAMTLHFRGPQRAAVRRMLGHAIAEVDHEQLAFDDIAALGIDADEFVKGEPLPSTVPMIAVPIYQMQWKNPIGYLGHVFFLEFMPTRHGAAYVQALQQAGVPNEALSFLAEHAEVDVQHNKLMERHVQDLVRSEEDYQACAIAIEVCGHLYAQMLQGAFDRVAKRDVSKVVV